MKVFSKEKYKARMKEFAEEITDEDIKESVEKIYEWSIEPGNWADVCDGLEVVDGRIAEFYITDTWCLDVEGENNE